MIRCPVTSDFAKHVLRSALISFLLLPCCFSRAQQIGGQLKAGFVNPPESARPHVWWHWMNGNITEEGIKLDLEWMHRVGLGGFQTFDAQLNTPQVVKERLVYMTPAWKHAFRYATTLADQLGLEEGIASSPGWSETGGPWVPPSEAMKKYVWSETYVDGGKPFHEILTHPPSNLGAFQDLEMDNGQWIGAGPTPQFYADSAVIAYKLAASDVPLDSMRPSITWSSGTLDPALLSDGKLNATTALPRAPAGEKAWIQYEFPQQATIRALTIVLGRKSRYEDIAERRSPDSGIFFEASNDGLTFHAIAVVPKGGSNEHTISFPPATARFFRVTFRTLPAPPLSAFGDLAPSAPPAAPMEIRIAELDLHPGARVNRFEEKAAFGWPHNQAPDLYQCATTPVTPADAISKSEIIDLTSRMKPDGTLDWTPPPGKWVILRFGYSLLGITNHPATAEATGLEVDKLDAHFVKHYMDGYLASYEKTVGTGMMGARGIKFVVTDSWEAGPQNWTDDMFEQFRKRRGYDLHPWLPVLAGRIVESAQASDRFLWDFRKTIADLTADEHYAQVEASLKERGMGHYGESHEGGRAFIADGMEVKKLDDIPMSAMWTQRPGVNKILYGYNADDRESASVAHIYGQNLVAAESMTAAAAPWAWSPATLKPTADMELLNGINLFVIHESAHQPLVGKGTAPGLTLGPYGQWFNRNETWAEEAGPWVNYLARSSYLLQQGHFSADVIYFYGEDSNLTAIFGDKSPDIPAGYGFDYINADGLIHVLKVNDGRITTGSGMSYRVLGLDAYSRHMSLPVLRAIYKFVQQGAIVAGAKPIDDPSLADDAAEFQTLTDELFGDGSGIHRVGKGAVYAGQSVKDTLAALHVRPDFDCTGQRGDGQILFVHRHLRDGDLYFVDNRSDQSQTVEASFRVTGKAPELWYAETGGSQPASYRISNGKTTVPLKLEPWGTVFVVFRAPATQRARTLPQTRETTLATMSGPWKLAFEPDLGAPPSITMNILSSWSENPDAGVKYFSGTGTYTNTLDGQRIWFASHTRIWLNLGDVKNLAEVTVNGENLGIVWHWPYRVEITHALKPGTNQISIKVTNAWVNRLIGDQQPGTTKYTYADVTPYEADSPLLPSGLLGPVTIERVATE